MRETDEPKPRFVNYYREPASERAEAFVANTTAKLLASETRQRKRRPQDQENFQRQASALISDLSHDVLGDGVGRYFRRTHRAYEALTRYHPPFLTKKVSGVVDAMITSGLITQRLGENKEGEKIATLITPTAAFAEAVTQRGLTFSDFKRGKNQETITLRERPADMWSEGKFLDYEDTEKTHRYRVEMKIINEALAKANLAFDHPLYPSAAVDLSERFLSRRFNGSFAQGGRLYGGFWQPLPKEIRKEGLRIDGEPVAVLDFGQMAVRLAYGLAGAEPPEGDAYLIEPYGEVYREGFKTLISAMLFSDKTLTKKPKGTKELLPRANVKTLCEAVVRTHSPIAGSFNRGLGLSLMYKESEVLVAILLTLIHSGITALPIHDALAVSVSNVEIAYRVMHHTFAQEVGINPIIKTE